VLLENLGNDGDSGVDRVGDDEDESLRAVSGNALSQITDDTGVDLHSTRFGGLGQWCSWRACFLPPTQTPLTESDRCVIYLEQIIASHAWLARDTSRNDNGVSTLEGLVHRVTTMASDLGLCVDMRKIGGDTGGVDDIKEGEVRDKVGLLQEQRERLADSSCGAADDDFDAVVF